MGKKKSFCELKEADDSALERERERDRITNSESRLVGMKVIAILLTKCISNRFFSSITIMFTVNSWYA